MASATCANTAALAARRQFRTHSWLDSTQLQALVAGNMPERRAHIAEELADVLIYAVQLARGLDIDVSDAMLQKIEIVKKRRDDPEYGRSHPHLD